MASDIHPRLAPAQNAPSPQVCPGASRVVIQPNMSVRGWVCDAGSRALRGFVALQDATVVSRLRKAGAALIGSSRMSELGVGLEGDTTAAFVNRGEADIALVTDTMGEARVAAADSGLFGFKPSFGTVSRAGLIGLVPSMECWGILAKGMKDIIETFSIIAGRDEADPSMLYEETPSLAAAGDRSIPPLSAGVIKECLDVLSERERSAFRAGLARLEEAGLTIREVSLQDFGLFRVVHNIVASVEASSSAGKYDGVRYGHRSSAGKNWNEMYLHSRGESFGPLLKAFLFQGAYFQFKDYPAFEDACRCRRRLAQAMTGLLGQVDLLASPTRRFDHDAAQSATITQVYDAFLLALPANVTGQPSLHIPCLAGNSGVDTGMQLTGSRLDDARLLSVGKKLCSASGGGR